MPFVFYIYIAIAILLNDKAHCGNLDGMGVYNDTKPPVGDSKNLLVQTKPRIDFPNYFSYLSHDYSLGLINEAMHSIIARLEVPFVHPKTQKLNNHGFFKHIQALVDEKAPGAKVYIAGGMVRSLLSYIYKKIYNADMRERAELGRDLTDEEMHRLVVNTLDGIVLGGKREAKNGESAFVGSTIYGQILTKEDVDGHAHNYWYGKDLAALKALGVGSDYDILIDFPAGFSGNKDQVIKDITDFINSAERYLGLRGDQNELKKSIVPLGDVNDYQKQFGNEGYQSAVNQGGSTLDWLAFPLTDPMSNGSLANTKPLPIHDFKMPDRHGDILKYFIAGHLQYLRPEPGVTLSDPDKQTIRGLRALLEIPFLTFDDKSRAQMASELTTVMQHASSMSMRAKEQLLKMIRNARFEGAHNRFNSSIPS